MIVIRQKSTKHFQSQIISLAEVQTKKPYISIQLRITDTLVNSNGHAVTADFLRDIVENKDDYIGLPLYADADKIRGGDYKKGLGHKFDEEMSTFYTEQVGSFHDFWLETKDDRVALIGEARVYKRDKAVASAILDLYAKEEYGLNFSFEVVAKKTSTINGVLWVDKDPDNKLIGVCIVSTPACASATALALVAEKKANDNANDISDVMERTFVAEEDFAEHLNAEVSLDTISGWIYEAVYKFVYDLFGIYTLSFYQIGVHSAILYDYATGRMYVVEYVVRESDVWVTDFYHAVVVKAETQRVEVTTEEREDYEVKNTMDAEVQTDVTENEVTETVDTVQAEAAGSTPEAVDIEDQHQTIDNIKPGDNVTTAEEEATEEAPAPTVEELMAQLAEQAQQIEALKEIEAKWNAAEDARVNAELAAKKAKVAEFAKNSGLDMESEAVVAAVDSMDYEALVDMAMDVKGNDTPAQETVAVAEAVANKLTGDTTALKGSDWLFQKA